MEKTKLNNDPCSVCVGAHRLCYSDPDINDGTSFVCAMCLAELDKCVQCSMINACAKHYEKLDTTLIDQLVEKVILSGGHVIADGKGEFRFEIAINKVEDNQPLLVEEHTVMMAFIHQSVENSEKMKPEEFRNWYLGSVTNIADYLEIPDMNPTNITKS